LYFIAKAKALDSIKTQFVYPRNSLYFIAKAEALDSINVTKPLALFTAHGQLFGFLQPVCPGYGPQTLSRM
jgi:hypothetical protein